MGLLRSLVSLLSIFMSSMVSGSTYDFGCNSVYLYSSSFYGTDHCYPDTSSSSDVSSFMFECIDGTMTKYGYSSRDCSGNETSAIDYSRYFPSYTTCNNSYISCDFFYIIKYDDDSDCDESGSVYDVYTTSIMNKCINDSGIDTSDGSYSPWSEYYTCSKDSYNVKYWWNSDSCSGDHDSSATVDPQYYNDLSYSTYDYKFYCSDAGEESECNEDSGFSMKNKHIVALIACLFVAIYNQS